MRDIKFRAWDKDKKVFTQSIDGVSLDGEILDLAMGEYGISNRTRNIELMQYTGLKDKNGKEIFENDIVTVKYKDGSGYDNPVEVSFEKGSFWVGMGYLNDIKIIEVIGNIYENKELLEGGENECNN